MSKMKLKIIGIGLVMILIAFGFLYQKNHSGVDIQPKKQSIKKENKEVKEAMKEEKGVFIGDQAYDFTLMDTEGNEIKQSSFKKKVVYIHFFTTWMNGFSEEMNKVQELYDQYKDEDVVVFAVDVLAAEKKKSQEDIHNELEEKGYTVPILYDTEGEVSVKYQIRSFPVTYIINKEGKISEFVSGKISKEDMQQQIETLRSE